MAARISSGVELGGGENSLCFLCLLLGGLVGLHVGGYVWAEEFVRRREKVIEPRGYQPPPQGVVRRHLVEKAGYYHCQNQLHPKDSHGRHSRESQNSTCGCPNFIQIEAHQTCKKMPTQQTTADFNTYMMSSSIEVQIHSE